MSVSRLTLVLVLTAVVLGFMIQERLSRPTPTNLEITAPTVAISEKVVFSGADLPDKPPAIKAYSEIIERPLFASTRRPPAPKEDPEPPMVKAAPLDPQPFSLVGTIIGQARKIAILRTKIGDQILSMSEQESVNGWRIDSIERNRVTVRHGATAQVISLHDSGTEPGRIGHNPVGETPNSPPSHGGALLSQRKPSGQAAGDDTGIVLLRYAPPNLDASE